nr:YoaK family protein [Escherichia coli]
MLTLTGGFCDAGSFVMLGMFTGHITGNTILTVVYLMQNNLDGSGYCVLSLVSFISGTIFGNMFRMRHQSQYDVIITLLLVQTVLIIIGTALWRMYNHVFFVLFLTLSMGLQNGIITHLNTVTVHSTYITGMTTTLLRNLTANCSVDDKKTRKIIFNELLFFIIGACMGSFLTSHFTIKGFLIVLIPISITGVLSFFEYRHNRN